MIFRDFYFLVQFFYKALSVTFSQSVRRKLYFSIHYRFTPFIFSCENLHHWSHHSYFNRFYLENLALIFLFIIEWISLIINTLRAEYLFRLVPTPARTKGNFPWPYCVIWFFLLIGFLIFVEIVQKTSHFWCVVRCWTAMRKLPFCFPVHFQTFVCYFIVEPTFQICNDVWSRSGRFLSLRDIYFFRFFIEGLVIFLTLLIEDCFWQPFFN